MVLQLVEKELWFGGSATDPIHWGHLELLKRVLTKAQLVFWYPSGSNGYKPNMTDGLLRQTMATLGIPQEWLYNPPAGWGKLFVDAGNTMSPEPPTALRFLQLEAQYPEYKVRFFTGSDVVTPNQEGRLPIWSWGEYTSILQYKSLVIIPRQGVNAQGRPFAQPGEVELPENMSWLDTDPLPDLQSSVIRKLIETGEAWEEFVDPKVASFIKLHQLYGYQG